MLVAGVTSNLSPRAYTVVLDMDQLEEGTIRHRSVVRSDKVFSISQAIVLTRFGRVNQQTFEQIRLQVNAVMAERA